MSKSPQILRLPEVVAKTGMSRTRILAAVAAGAFPAPFKIVKNGRAIGWSAQEIDDHIAQQMREARTNIIKP